MKVLVTGASGFLGGHVAELLSNRGDRVRALVRRTSNRKHLKQLANVELFDGGIEEIDRVREAGRRRCRRRRSLRRARESTEHRRILRGQRGGHLEPRRGLRAGRGLKRFVHVSSLEACGPSADGFPVSASQENPVTAYGRSKLSAEKVVLAAKDDMGVVILRPGAIYGPRDGEILEAFKAIQRGLLPLVGGGGAKGMWIYATDCAEACLRAIDADVPSGRVYFVDDGGGPIDQKQMLFDAERALGKRALVRASLPVPVFMAVARGLETLGRATNRPVMLTREKANMLLQHWVCSSEVTRQELGWTPKVPWSEGLPRAVRWYRENGWL